MKRFYYFTETMVEEYSVQGLHGPFRDEDAQLAAAKQVHKENPGCDTAFFSISAATGKIKWSKGKPQV